MPSTPASITCVRCGTANIPASQYECQTCGKPNLKAIIPASMAGGRWVLFFGGGAFGLLAVLTLLQSIVFLTK
jgi:hypothetical protein